MWGSDEPSYTVGEDLAEEVVEQDGQGLRCANHLLLMVVYIHHQSKLLEEVFARGGRGVRLAEIVARLWW